MLLDLELSDLDGLQVCGDIGATSDTPVIALTAHGAEPDRILGLRVGLDDYLVKLCGLHEFVARIKAVTRRTHLRPRGGRIILPGPLQTKSGGPQVHLDSGFANPTRKEYDLLTLFASQLEIVFSRKKTMPRVWDATLTKYSRTIDTHGIWSPRDEKRPRAGPQLVDRQIRHLLCTIGWRIQTDSNDSKRDIWVIKFRQTVSRLTAPSPAPGSSVPYAATSPPPGNRQNHVRGPHDARRGSILATSLPNNLTLQGGTTLSSNSLPPGAAPSEPAMENDLGPIAESYDLLHQIPKLRDAKLATSLQSASYDSSVVAIFHGAELALHNLAALTERCAAATRATDIVKSGGLFRWISGFHAILRGLGDAASVLRLHRPSSILDHEYVSIDDSPAYRSFLTELRAFDSAVRDKLLGDNTVDLKRTISTRSNEDPTYSFLHGIRLAAHDSVKWESDLHRVPVAPGRGPLSLAITTGLIKEAVEMAQLRHETFYGQFVALHQIPEVLCAEVCDHIEAAIRNLRSQCFTVTVEHFQIVRALLDVVVRCQRVMAECLSTKEYHEFRENLGPASGMHSLTIRQHMFHDLFECLWEDVHKWVTAEIVSTREAVGRLSDTRHQDAEKWLSFNLLNETFIVHQLYQEWRHEHLHMPRNCLGSGGTKSMIGVRDGLTTVIKMRDTANSQPALVDLHESRGVRLAAQAEAELAAHHLDPKSLDSTIKSLVGEATRDYFPQVQRESYKSFHSGCPVRRP